MLSQKHQSAFESNSAFMVKIEDLVREIAIQNSIPYYRIESRMEHYAHMGAEESYMPVIRVITYFEDTVKQMTEVLHSEFEMVPGKSVDKKKSRIDTFSYKRIQYVGNLKANRRGLVEYKRLGDKKFELQLCSMLQDAWSGIENELGYDAPTHTEESKRDFYRMGALLEMADIEFLKIRTEAVKKQDAPAEQTTQPQAVTETIKTEAPAAAPINTVSEHLQAVAAPVAEIIPEVTAPVAPQPQAVAAEVIAPIQEAVAPIVEQPQAVVAEAIAPIQEVVAPVAEQPQAVVAEVAAPIEEAVAAPVMQQVVAEVAHKAVNTFAAASIVPQRAIPETPKPAAPAGIVPQRVATPVEEVVNKVETAAMNVDSTGTLAMNEETAEHTPAESKNYIIDEKISEIINTGSVVEHIAPAIQEEAHTVIVNAVTPPAIEIPQPTPEAIIAPLVNNIPTIIPEVIAPKAEQVNNNTPKTPEVVAQQSVSPQKVVPFFEEQQSKATKVILDENAPMTETSLKEYVANSNLLKEVDTKIAERAGAKINPDIDIEGDVERLRFLKVFTLKQLQDRITDNKVDIIAFAEKWIGKDNGGSFDSGISLFYLEYLLVGKKNDPAFAIEYVVKFISDNDYSARYIIPTYNSIRSTEVTNNFSHLTIRA